VPGEKCDVLIIGGGPAGLRAAEIASGAGWQTILADRMPSVGRKFLVAGRGGLNLTHSEPMEKFPARYGGDSRWSSLLADFSPAHLRAWAEGLGVETFVGTSGRVFPTTKQAAPLLRRWIKRLKEQKVEFRTRHEWTSLREGTDHAWQLDFRTPEGFSTIQARAVILALGGGSWPQTGSNGAWIEILRRADIEITPLTAANCGYEVAWTSAFLEAAEGQPLKNIVVHAGGEQVAGELLVTRYGLEGGAIYQLGRALREMPSPRIILDLKPAFTVDQLLAKLPSATHDQLLDTVVRHWKLSPVAAALVRTRCEKISAESLASLVKAFPLDLLRPRPLAEAISSAGGVAWSELNDDLMLKRCPGIFCAGEMIDWEAPTGGYLLQGCFSTATRATRGLIRFLNLPQRN
jgi:uncharacterized flavoprotein (TIGR03862 family)